MKIREVMSKKIITIEQTATLLEAAKLLFKHQISGILVTDGAHSLVGVLSEKDLYRSLYPSYTEFYEDPSSILNYGRDCEDLVLKAKNTTIKEVMATELITVTENDMAIKAGAIMLAKVVNRLPVINERGKLVGIISRRDIYQKIFQKALDL